MDMMQKALLAVHSGTSNFSSASDSIDDIRAFQPLAKALFAAYQNGYIESANFIVSHKRDSHGMYTNVQTSGGLTHSGVQKLSKSGTREWLMDKATVFAVGVAITVAAGIILYNLGIKV